MSPTLALCLCVVSIAWLFYKDCRRRENISYALWIPLFWLLIVGSRPISFWFGVDIQFEATSGYLEGDPMDGTIFFCLIIAGLFVLLSRSVNWRTAFLSNKWIFIFFLYCLISVLWSDYQWISLKRWVKDFGNVIMVMVVLTEEEPLEALKALLARSSYVLIPLTVLLVKYYPEVGRYYNPWTFQSYICGLTTDKNLLGMTLFVWSLSQLWLLFEWRGASDEGEGRIEMYAHLFLMLMTVWLLFKSQSSTALFCTVIGCCVLLGVQLPAIRDRAHRFGVYAVAMVLLVLVLHMTFNVGELLVGILGRDLTFTGRTEMWRMLLNQDVNPLLGSGYYSFWLGSRVATLSANYFYHLNEAHNGYLETYLNGGLIGVFLLVVLLVTAIRRSQQEVVLGLSQGALRLAFVIAIAIYGMTEAVFRFGPMWFVLLLVIMEYPNPDNVEIDGQDTLVEEVASEPEHDRKFTGFYGCTSSV
jgi:exopolysaccharide production protein ExoQ